MLIHKIITKASIILSITAIFSTPIQVSAGNYAPYPGKLSAKLVSINSTSSINLSADVWPGFSRTFSISLANIEVPKNNPDVQLCQRELAEKTLNFIKNYLTDASSIEIRNMTMQSSADQNVRADIFTEKGNLSKALKSQGLARSSDIEPNKPWC